MKDEKAKQILVDMANLASELYQLNRGEKLIWHIKGEVREFKRTF